MAERDYSTISSKAEELWTRASSRRQRYQALAVRYFQDAYRSGNEDIVVSLGLDEAPEMAIGRAHVDAAVSKIAGVQRPRVQFMTTRANWKLRRAVSKLDQFIHGVFASPCAQFSDVWAMKSLTARDAFMLGDGFERVFVDPSLDRATFARVAPWEILVDDDDARDGFPTEMFWRHSADVDSLVAAYPKKAAVIRESRSPVHTDDLWMPGVDSVLTRQRSNQRLIIEHWTRKIGDEDGEHVVLTPSGQVIAREPWPFPWFPFQHLSWCPPVVGYWGSSLLEQSGRMESWINSIIRRIKDAVDNSSTNIVVAEEGSLAKPGDAFVKDNSVVIYKKGHAPPTVQTPQSFNPQLFQLLETFYGKSFELTGVNQMSATAQKQPGIEANSAIQTMADLQSERFSVVWNDYQTSFVELARKATLLTRDHLKGGKKRARVQVPGDRFMNSVPWPDGDLDEEMFTVQAQPAPSSKWTMASRVQQAENLAQGGILSPDALVRVQQFGDTQAELDRINRQSEYTERMIERWLDATDEQIESNMIRPDDPDSPQLIPVIPPVLDVEAATLLVGAALLDAIFDEVPDRIQALFYAWLDQADQILSQSAAAQAPPAPAPPEGEPGVPQ